MLETTLSGSQPKIFDGAHDVNLRVIRNKLDKEKVTSDEVEAAVQATIRFTVEDQITAGIDRVTDGRIRWDDPVTPLAKAHQGFSNGGLIRYFDNNVYYRRPTIDAPIVFDNSTLAEDFRLIRAMTDRPIMASVCGPFSLAKFCLNKHYDDPKKLYIDCAHLIGRELEALASAGADWVQLDEPYLGFCPDDIESACDAIALAVHHSDVKTYLYTYFSPIKTIAGHLWKLPVTAIGADCVTVPANIEVLLEAPPSMGRGFGLADARSTRMEQPGRIEKHLERLRASGAENWPVCFVSPSTGLEFLPYMNAQQKMQRIVNAVQSIRQPAAAV